MGNLAGFCSTCEGRAAALVLGPVVTVSGATSGKVRNRIIREIKTLHVNFPGGPGTGQ